MWLDLLFNLLGIPTAVWLFVVGLTGTVDALSTPIFEHWQRTDLAAMLAPYRKRVPRAGSGAVDRALARLEAEYPNERPDFVALRAGVVVWCAVRPAGRRC